MQDRHLLRRTCRVTDIVADVGRPVRLRFSNKQPGPRECTLPVLIDIPEALHALTQSQPCESHMLSHCWLRFELSMQLIFCTHCCSNNMSLQATMPVAVQGQLAPDCCLPTDALCPNLPTFEAQHLSSDGWKPRNRPVLPLEIIQACAVPTRPGTGSAKSALGQPVSRHVGGKRYPHD